MSEEKLLQIIEVLNTKIETLEKRIEGLEAREFQQGNF